MTATPTAISSYVMAREMDSDWEMTSDVVMLSTLLSILSLSAWLLFLL